MTMRKIWLTILTLVAVISVGVNAFILSSLTDNYFVDYLTASYEDHVSQIVEYTKKSLLNNPVSYEQMAIELEAHLDDPEHPQAGLYQFKRGFNDDVTEFVGCWDLPISETKYKIWKRQERKFLKLYTKMTKNLFW